MNWLMLTTLALASTPTLDGTWMRRQVTVAVSEVPVLGEVTSETEAIVLLRIKQSGRDLRIEEQVCHLQTETLKGLVKTVYPPAFREAVSFGDKQGRILSTAKGLRYAELKQIKTVGARTSDAEPLPTRADDPRVTDADRNGRPGVTIGVEGFIDGEIHLVHRTVSELRGRFVGRDRITGGVRWRVEQSILGASRDSLASAPKTYPHPDGGRHRFWMVRVPKATTCGGWDRLSASLFSSSSSSSSPSSF